MIPRPLKIKFKDQSFLEIGITGEMGRFAYVLLCGKDGKKTTLSEVNLSKEQLTQILDFIDKIVNVGD